MRTSVGQQTCYIHTCATASRPRCVKELVCNAKLFFFDAHHVSIDNTCKITIFIILQLRRWEIDESLFF